MIMRDFECVTCQFSFEAIVDSSEVKETPCPQCHTDVPYLFSAPWVGVLNDPDRKAEILKRRSHADTLKQVRKEPERFGMTNPSPWNARKRTGK